MHFIREKVLDKFLEVDYVDGAEQVANIFTKPLGTESFRELWQKLCMHNYGGIESSSS